MAAESVYSGVVVEPCQQTHPHRSDCISYNGKFVKVIFDNLNCETFSKTYQDADFNDAPDGVYVWIYVATEGSKDFHFYFRQTISFNEICTKHMGLLSILKDKGTNLTLHSAGELLKENGEITMNLMSGTFMTGIPLNVLDQASEKLKLFVTQTVTPDHNVKDTYITEDRFPQKYGEDFLRKLVEHGAGLEIYNTRSNCNELYEKLVMRAQQEFALEKKFKRAGDPEPVFKMPKPLYVSKITNVKEFDEFVRADPRAASEGGKTRKRKSKKLKRTKNKKYM